MQSLGVRPSSKINHYLGARKGGKLVPIGVRVSTTEFAQPPVNRYQQEIPHGKIAGSDLPWIPLGVHAKHESPRHSGLERKRK
jgi:hypothetical protein